MSCNCTKAPCGCSTTASAAGPCALPSTKCDLYRKGDKNVWVERGCSSVDVDVPGICMLDTMTEDQVIYVIERDDKARRDLLTVTSDVNLRHLAESLARLPTEQDDDKLQTDVNRNHAPASTPFYALFRGQPPFAQ